MVNVHALIIDDNAYNVEVLERLLTSLGGSFTTLQDPTRLEAIAPELDLIDIVFLDLEMPKRNGYQMMQILRMTWGYRFLLWLIRCIPARWTRYAPWVLMGSWANRWTLNVFPTS